MKGHIDTKQLRIMQEMRHKGRSFEDIAQAVGLTRQRVHQKLTLYPPFRIHIRSYKSEYKIRVKQKSPD